MARFDPRRLPRDWPPEAEALLEVIDEATATPVYISYRLAPEWFDGVHLAIDDVEDLAAQHPGPGLDLIEHAFDRLNRKYGSGIDDSEGGLTEACDRLMAVHADLAGPASRPRLLALELPLLSDDGLS